MRYRRLGRSGLRVSEVGFGAWQFSGDAWGEVRAEEAERTVEKALELGVNFFDTAQVYGRGRSEELLGEILRKLGATDEVVIATKIPGERLAYHDVKRATELSLRRLRKDAIDLYQIHWPSIWNHVPISETMKAMEELVEAGLVRYIGLSNFPPCLAEQAQQSLKKYEIVSNQLRYNVLEREVEKEYLPYLRERGMSLIAWSPLAKGALTGKYTPENLPSFQDVRANDPLFHPENFREAWRIVQLLKEIGEKYGKTPGQVALNWLLRDPLVIPIPGAKNPRQVEENAGASGWTLSEEDWRRITEASSTIRINRVLW